jgi:hypothetical protein
MYIVEQLFLRVFLDPLVLTLAGFLFLASLVAVDLCITLACALWRAVPSLPKALAQFEEARR